MSGTTLHFGWFRMLRLALVQSSLGAIVVLATSTLNRVMIVEFALPAVLPAALIAVHYLVQLLRPRIGYGADQGGRCAPWIIGGVAVLASGGLLAALAATWMPTRPLAGSALALAAYVAIGLGVSAAGTSNLVLLTKRIAPERRPVAATLLWVMMIAGFGVSAALVGHFLQPFSPQRLLTVYAVANASALLLATVAVWGIEPDSGFVAANAAALPPQHRPQSSTGGFRAALAQLWADPQARSFTLFLFVSMLAYSAQDLLTESFAGLVFGYTPGASAQLSGLQHGGVVLGMISVALIASRWRRSSFRIWMLAGTVGSAVGIGTFAVVSLLALASALPFVAFLLGLANGMFAVAALNAMMELSAAGGRGREGLRMGLWGASQAVAFAIGGLGAGTVLDVARRLAPGPAVAYAAVFSCGALLFLLAARHAWRVGRAVMVPPGRPLAVAPADLGKAIAQ